MKLRQTIKKLGTLMVILTLLLTTTLYGADANTPVGFGFDPSTGTITSYKGYTTYVMIPDTIDGVTVTTIGEGAFSGDTTTTRLLIPASITTIHPKAFLNCSLLENFEVAQDNKRFKTIEGIIFSLDESTLHVYPAGKIDSSYQVPSSVLVIDDYAFSTARNLKTITLQEGLTTINTYAFEYCSNLNNLDLPMSITSIKAYAFKHCTSFTDIDLPKNITIVEEGLFSNCSSLREISFSKSTKTIEKYAFDKTSNLSAIKLPETLEVIGDSAFSFNSSLKEISIPNKVTTLGAEAFLNCTTLETVTLNSDKVTTIKESTFKNCASLLDVSLPYGVNVIEKEAFANNTSLEHIKLPFSLTSINQLAFSNCIKLAEVSIPSSVTSIDKTAFRDSDSVTFLTHKGTYGDNYAISYFIKRNDLVEVSDKELHETYAKHLSRIGVFKGTDNGFELDRSPTRIEGLIMLIRLLGKESDALALADKTPAFSDVPSWALGYVNYAYDNGLTNGIGNGLFGSNQALSSNSYLTYVLRALGYESGTDFEWSSATVYAYNQEIINLKLQETLLNTPFLRGHVAQVSYESLLANMKASNLSLGYYLVEEGAIDRVTAQNIGIID